MANELSVEQLRRICDPQTLNCSSSEELKPIKAIIGQDRAARSLQFGLGIQAMGFNVCVVGQPGTGRTKMVESFLEQVARDQPAPSDWCYVYNWGDASQPEAIRLPAGQARQFQTDMKKLIEGAQQELHKAFDSEDYAAKRKETSSSFEKQAEDVINRVNEKAQQEGFVIQQSPTGIVTIPLRRGRPMSQEEFIALSQADKNAISQRQQELQDEIETAVRQARSVNKSATEELDRMDQQVALYALSHLLDDLKGKYKDLPEVLSYLDAVRDDILENLDNFRDDQPEQQPTLPFLVQDKKAQFLKRYSVNVLVDNGALKGAPVVIESNPTYNNLFGRIENEAQFGTLTTDFTLIRQGTLHRANGGYLVLPVYELLSNPFSWDGLKRALRNQQIDIEDPYERMGYMTTRTLQPEPVPLSIKVVLVGTPDLYNLLRSNDQDFAELFKVKADFDSQMDRTDADVQDYIALVGEVCSEDKLKHLDNSALAKIVEQGSRLAEDQTKLSTRFGELADIIREASYYATLAQSPNVTAEHVVKAIEEKFYRSDMIQVKLNDMIARGELMIDVQGERVGQINGLSVLELGDIEFGMPSRITVSVGVGREGLIDIEREAKLGGPTHTKGVMILAGYLMEKYAQDKPVSLSARLVFEQSYSGIDGDSASSTELYAILSELSGVPIQQYIAVTGSVNQKGEVQAIGGVNEKIEGYFEVCKRKGLNGKQGVMIPASNAQDLMLKEEVVQAVRDGQFHVWTVNSIDEGIELLTGVKAGQKKEDGTFEEGSINEKVNKRLKDLSEILVKFGKDEEEK
ncbi:MAG TPA: AAA family ATPase [Anaerolineaceae bacterium]|nr:AAA family ATPase [Anaerolineaceae bacterium]